MSKRLLISTSSFGADPRLIDEIVARGFEITVNPHGRTLKADEVRDLLTDKVGVIAGTERLDDAAFVGASRLRVISRVGVGLDNVDLAAAARRGIVVCNTPEATIDPVAELTVAGMLAVLRDVPRMNADLHARRWNRRMGRLLGHRTVGIIGAGRIGRRVADLVRAFGADVIVCDPVVDWAWLAGRNIEVLPLDVLLARADIVSLHASAPAHLGALIGRRELTLMAPWSLLINTSRGHLVEETALADALRAGRLAGAYLDTFGREPYDGPLCEEPTVLLTPHAGAFTQESRIRMEREAAQNLLRVLDAESIPCA